MEITTKATTVLEKNLKAYEENKWRYIVNEGGSGSSKTYSLAQLFTGLLHKDPSGLRISIVRKTLPALKASAMRDFFAISEDLQLYNIDNHNKTDMIYRYGKSFVEFFAADDYRKLKSRRRDILWVNEVDELKHDEFKQLAMRTDKVIFLDYNPHDEFHWVYDQILTDKETHLIHSTYKDNPFLPKSVVAEIERYKETDENYWRIYGLGMRGVSGTRVFTAWHLVDELPEGERIYGMDFGFNNPTAIVEVVFNDDNLYATERLYETRLNSDDIIRQMEAVGISKVDYIYGDSEDPRMIEDIRRAGFNIYPALKDKGSVKKGIDEIKKRKLHIVKDSVNLQKEIKSYSWKTKDGKPLGKEEPVKINDHLCDALRYAVYTHNYQSSFLGFV